MFLITKLRNFKNLKIWKIKKIYKKNFQFEKPKFGSKNFQLELFVYSIFRTTRDFTNSHICSLI